MFKSPKHFNEKPYVSLHCTALHKSAGLASNKQDIKSTIMTPEVIYTLEMETMLEPLLPWLARDLQIGPCVHHQGDIADLLFNIP